MTNDERDKANRTAIWMGVIIVLLIALAVTVASRSARAEDWDENQIHVRFEVERMADLPHTKDKLAGFYIYLNQVDCHHLVGCGSFVVPMSLTKLCIVSYDVQDCVGWMIRKKEIIGAGDIKPIFVAFYQSEIKRPKGVPWSAGKEGIHLTGTASLIATTK